MFSQISWTDYVQILFFLLGIYYAFVIFTYYRKDLFMLMSKRQKATGKTLAGPSLGSSNLPDNKYGNDVSQYMPQSGNHYDLMVQTLLDELNAFITEAGHHGFDKEQILASVQLLLDKYPSVKSSPHKESIQQFIIEQCKHHCSVHFSDLEMQQLWA